MSPVVWPGEAVPLGASFDGAGTNFALFSEGATRVDLCLFDPAGHEEIVPLPECTGHVWHGYLPDVVAGQRYGYRVHGVYEPERGTRYNPNKLLVDPYARAIEGEVMWNDAVFPYDLADPDGAMSATDSAPFVPRSVVVNPFFDWSSDRSPRTPWADTVVYETHVKNFSFLHPDIPQGLRGTYRALAHPAAIDHFQALGVTAIELMPVHQFVHDRHLVERGLRNAWGYSTIGYFAPHNEYAASGGAGEQVQEFKTMVRALHDAGLEVILDVVYNHTAEGNHLGPMLSFKGIDNAAYYRLVPDDQRYYFDYTGTGNTLNVRNPFVLQLIMDSLRYWINEMHVDGFRFDLAASLARQFHEVDRLSAFFDLIQQDPVVSRVKLIAEPWDVGEGGYQVGNFPPLWSEWNGRYRDAIRDYWRGEPSSLGELANRLTGSSDLYQSDGRRPFASINFVTAHDGFTLRDLVSCNEPHNEANEEESGESHNRSWNCGAEGPTDDSDILGLRHRQVRNFLATLLLSQGVPMVLGGDEIGRTQQGNNNAYCQDNAISWYDWEGVDRSLLDYTARLVRFRQEHPVFRRSNWFAGHPIGQRYEAALPDVAWFGPDGSQMEEQQWAEAHAQCVTVFLNGDAITARDRRGEAVHDDSFLLCFNAGADDMTITVPSASFGDRWTVDIDTGSFVTTTLPVGDVKSGEPLELPSRSVIVLRRVALSV